MNIAFWAGWWLGFAAVVLVAISGLGNWQVGAALGLCLPLITGAAMKVVLDIQP